MQPALSDVNKIFFIGIAGTGMSALAQYLHGIGKIVSGSDRYFSATDRNPTRQCLQRDGINCFMQNGEGITSDLDLVVVSAAVEDNVEEVKKALMLGIPLIKRSELLSMVVESKKTVAIGGTSGKSTTSAMLFTILEYAGLSPSIISGAGLVSIMAEGKIGNAKVGKGEWLIIEADESDGSIVQYHPFLAVLLNIDKDHKEIDELKQMFSQFCDHARHCIVNQSHLLASGFSKNASADFAVTPHTAAGYEAVDFRQSGLEVQFQMNGTNFSLQVPGKHNVENAAAAIAAAHWAGVSLPTASAALKTYQGIYRRHQVLGQHKGIWVIDDYAHNPAKCAASIQACQAVAPKVIAWFQPHGYGPTRFLRQEFVQQLAAVLREQDEIWMSEIFYAGGTAVKDISAADLVKGVQAQGKTAWFLPSREMLVSAVRSHCTDNCVLLLMGARDPRLEDFARQVWEEIQAY